MKLLKFFKKIYRSKNFRYLLFSFIICFVFVVIIEILSMAFLISPRSINNWGFNRHGLGDLLPNKNFIADEVPNLPYQVVTNNEGFRSFNPTNIKKLEGKIRIIAVGDSFTFGPYVNNQDTYPIKLENYLKEKSIDTEVLNAGVSGYTLQDEMSYLKDKGFHLKPDLIIIGVYQNDVSDYQDSQRSYFSRDNQKTKYSLILNIAKKSAFLTFLERKISQSRAANQRVNVLNSKSEEEPDYKKELDAYINDLNILIDEADRRNIKLLLVFFPSFDQLLEDKYFPQDNIKSILILKDVDHIDLLSNFKSHENKKLLYLLPFNGHLSSTGNDLSGKLIADKVFDILKDK